MTEATQQTPYQRLIGGRYGLALTYWGLFVLGAVLFFGFASLAVSRGAWVQFVIMLLMSIAWTFILLIGIRQAIESRGVKDPAKMLARIAMLFFLMNMTNALATLSFI